MMPPMGRTFLIQPGSHGDTELVRCMQWEVDLQVLIQGTGKYWQSWQGWQAGSSPGVRDPPGRAETEACRC